MLKTAALLLTLAAALPAAAADEKPDAAARAKAVGRTHADVLWHLTPTTFEPGDLRFHEILIEAGYRTFKLKYVNNSCPQHAGLRKIAS